MDYLVRTPLLLEGMPRPSVTGVPKARTRRLTKTAASMPTRRSMFARIERRCSDRITPQAREVARGRAEVRRVNLARRGHVRLKELGKIR